MSLFKPPFVILEKSLLTSKVFFGGPAVYFIRIPISCSNATAILEYSTFNYITLQHKWKTADSLGIFLHLFKHSLKAFVVKNQHNRNLKK